MEIIIKENKKTTEFGNLIRGTTFIDPEYGGTVFMVVRPNLDVKLESDRDDDAEYAGYAVDLSNGNIYGYESTEEIIIVDTTLTAEVI